MTNPWPDLPSAKSRRYSVTRCNGSETSFLTTHPMFKQRIFQAIFSLLLGGSAVAQSFKLQSVHSTGGAVTIDWLDAGAGQAYTVQSRDSLTDGVWTSPIEVWPTSSLRWIDQRPGAASRFYRVAAVPVAERGKVISVTPLAALSVAQIGALFVSNGIPIVPLNAVTITRVTYETIDLLGGKTMASGAIVLPVKPAKPAPLVSCQHLTAARRDDVPSRLSTELLTVGVALASTGYAVSMADYLGMGSSPGAHPFHHARSEATACVDMLRAARTVVATNGLAVNNQLFLIGYSQGGHATMALHRELEAFHTNEFTVTASAPMAGDFDLSGISLDDVLTGRPFPDPYFFPLFLAAYQNIYHLDNSLADILAAPYDKTLPPLLDGSVNGATINAAMPAEVIKILKPSFLAGLRANPNHPFRAAARDNDLLAWTPRAAMQIFHCAGDMDSPVANATAAVAAFRSRGALQVTHTDPSPSSNHFDCGLVSYFFAKLWFDGLKK